MKFVLSAAACALLVSGCAQTATDSQAFRVASASSTAAETWRDPSATENARVADLIARMTLEQKVAQLIQPQINSFTAEDMKRYRFGSYLNGGNGGPYGDEFAPASQWLRLADEMWDASTAPLPDGQPSIPAIWGTDAVHGHTNVIGATIFPHNVALGATGDADLVRRIGAATAAEIAATGIDWNFSPTVAVAQDSRWGRAYESYSQDPDIVARLGAALVEGLQGRKGSPEFLRDGHVIATAKHFFGDGGTKNGVDQGDVDGDIDELKALHAKPYPATIAAGVQSVMASFNSVNGRKMHGNEALLTGVLRGEMGFDGVVVGDWNGHGQVAGCTVTNCPQALLAGLDIYMVPDDWKELLQTTVAQVRDGTIPMAKLDRAVDRVLRMKLRAGLLDPDAKRPSERPAASTNARFGTAEHRAIAREAVAKSQVILKNNGVLPLKPGANILVAGDVADSVAAASGGWTLTWQGGLELGNDRYFPGATSIWDGIAQVAKKAGGTATLSPDGSFQAKPDVAIVVFGEQPYAEFAGDRKDLVLRGDDAGLELLRKYHDAGIPTVAILLSGRPLWMNRELNVADAFLASWLPGGEGAGVADVLTASVPATGRLAFDWPRHCEGEAIGKPSNILFPLGYGHLAGEAGTLPKLSEECAALEPVESSDLFVAGRLDPGVGIYATRRTGPSSDPVRLDQFRGKDDVNGIAVRGIDRNAQEDAREIVMSADSSLKVTSQTASDDAFRIVYQVPQRPLGPVKLVTQSGDRDVAELDITQDLAIAEGKDWRTMVVTADCAPGSASGFEIRTGAPFKLQIAEITRVKLADGAACSF